MHLVDNENTPSGSKSTSKNTPKSLYRITIKNFSKHNSTLKKGHKSTLISNNFCTDSKLGMVPLTVRWMFLGIVLTAGDHTRDTVEMSERQLRELLESSWSVPRALDALQSLQVLSYHKIDFLLNRIEKNRIEKNRKEIILCDDQKSEVQEISKVTISIADKSASLVPVILENKVSKVSPKKTFSVNSYKDFDQIFTLEQKHNYYSLYPDIEFLTREFKKIHNWLIANPAKNLKTFRGWSQAVSFWLDKAWPQHQKNYPTNKADQSSVNQDEINERISKLFEVKP